jgi:DNA-binding transcriptional MerR regulator
VRHLPIKFAAMLIAQLERLSGQTHDTIRYYERLGLITPPQRGDNGYRRYDQRTVAELSFIAKAQEVGFTLQQIKPSMAHLHAPPEQCQELIDGLQAKRVEIEARMAQDRTRLVRLNKMIKRLKGRGT